MSKRIFIFISCVLLCSAGFVSACDWYTTGSDWAPQGNSTDWGDGANWSSGSPPTFTDGCGTWARLALNMVGPDIDEDVKAARISVAVWCSGNDNIDVNILSGDVNANWGFGIADKQALGFNTGEYGRGYGKVNMYGGNLSAPLGRTNLDGQYQFGALGIGGGDFHDSGSAVGGCGSNYLDNYGELFVYDGNITVPTVEVTDGVINLWGGKLTCTTATGHVFEIYRQVRSPSPAGPIYQVPSNKGINLGGGTLSIAGDHTADGNFLTWIADGRIIAYGYDTWSGPNCLFLSRGDIAIDFNGTYTNFTGIAKLGRSWNPQPVVGADQLEFDPPPMLSWGAGDWVQTTDGHEIYFSTDSALVTSGDPSVKIATTTDPNYTFGSALAPGVRYYWKVNEVNTADGNSPWEGKVWNFRVRGGSAVNPTPASGSSPEFNITQLELTWTPGVFISPANGHRVYFGTSSDSVLNATTATAKIYRQTTSSALYQLKNLAPDYVLAGGSVYYWRVDEVNTTSGEVWPGEVWNFTMPNYAVVDDFSYASADDFNAVWLMHLKKAGCLDDCYLGGPGGEVSLRTADMNYVYDDGSSGSHCPWSEVRRDYNGAPADWRVNGVFPSKAISLTYTGSITNAADPVYDRMYVAIEDSAGRFGMVLNPDTVAEARQVTATWQIKLSDLNGAPNNVALSDINAMYIGFGERCTWNGLGVGGTGSVIFDDIRLYLNQCTQGDVVGDFNADCFVNVYDLDIMASDWLDTDTVLTYATYTAPLASGLKLRYNFDEASGTTAADSSGNANDGTVDNLTTTTWDTTGGYDGGGCINFDWGRRTGVTVPSAALSFFDGGTGVTLSIWIKVDRNHPPAAWEQPFTIYRAGFSNYGDCFDIKLPTAAPSAMFAVYSSSSTSQMCTVPFAMEWADFADRWNHYALTYDDTNNMMKIYRNGTQIGENNNVTITMPPAPTAVYVGKRGADWGYWYGRVDDVRVYNYPLNAAEVAYIATKTTGTITVPLVEVTNLVASSPQKVNFRDFAMMAQQWLVQP